VPSVAAGSGVAAPTVDTGQVLEVLLGLLAVLAVIGVLSWALRHVMRPGGAAGGLIQVVGSTSLGTRERVVLIQVGGEQVLVGVTPGRLQTLHVLDRPVALPDPAEPAGFPAQLARILGRPSPRGPGE
jgi:flagellar protein FliO/FliZ